MLLRVVWYILTDVSEVLTFSITRAIGGSSKSSEKSVNFYQAARRNFPEDSHINGEIYVYPHQSLQRACLFKIV
jgi:hypothetical protein